MERMCGVAGPPRTRGHSSVSNWKPILSLCLQATASVTVAMREDLARPYLPFLQMSQIFQPLRPHSKSRLLS